MSRTIATIISLRDQFTAPARRIAESTRGVNREVQRTINQVKKFSESVKNTTSNVVKNFAKWGGAAAGIAAGFVAKTSLTEAMDLEGFRLTLETVMKDSKKAKELLSWGSDFANATPFETKEITEGIVKLQSYGLTAKEVLPSIGDMASVMGKSLDQAVEAIADGQTGSLERLKEFGISKDMIIKQAEKLRLGLVVNKKGQITDQEKFNKAMFSLMNDKFAGGMAKQAGTMKGIWSTITGVSKSALANIMGITKDGSIKQGSIYEQLKSKILVVGDALTKWSSDGTIDRIATQVTAAVAKMVAIIKEIIIRITEVYNFFKNNWSTIVPIVSTVVTAFLAYKAITIAQTVYTKAFAIAETIKAGVLATGAIKVNAMTIAQWAWNAAMKANPIGVVIGVITLLVAGLVLAYNKSETFRNIVQGLWDKLKGFSSFVLTIPEMVKGIWDGFISKTQALWDKITSLVSPLKDAAGWVGKLFGGGDKNIKVTTTNTTKTVTGKKPLQMYAKGGIATKASIFGEAGAEIAIPLNNSQRSKDLLAQANGIINKNGNTKGNLQNINVDKKSSLTQLNNSTNNTNSSTNNTTNNSINNQNSNLNTTKNNTISNNSTTQKTVNSNKKESKIEVVIQGDVYGFDDFKEKVSKAIVEIINQIGGNMVVTE